MAIAIKKHVISASTRSRVEQDLSMFWVYLTPEANANAAYKLSQKLIQNKIRDYYIISKTDKKNGISLGHFKDKDRAYGHAERLKKLGFSAEVDVVFRSYEIYWLDYKVGQRVDISPDILKRPQFKGIKQFDRDCK